MASALVASAETYSSWQAVHFTGAQVAVAAISGPQADPDGDGLSNLLEYASASDPWIADTQGAAVLGQSQDHLTLSYRRVRTAMDLFTTLQVSGDLTSGWSFPENVAASTDSSNAVYDRITLTDSQTVSGVNKRFLRLTVAIDSDQDGLPDDWEMRFFGNLDHLAGDDDDLDTLTNLMEYHRQTDPMDFYNGEAPVLSMNAGNNQTGFAGAELPATLVVKVWHQDGVTAWPNAPVVFATTAGGFFSAGDSPVVVKADGNGAVGLSYTLPNTPGPLTITATAGKAPNQRSVTFAETVSALPMSLGAITTEGTGTSIILTWTPTPAASSYTAQHFNPVTHTWETVATASAGSSTLTDPGTNLVPGVIALYKILGNDGSNLHSESAVEGGIINPEDNNDTDTLTNGEEVAAGSYAKERAENELQTGNLAFGGNPAGWMGPDPKLPDTDADGVADDLDGWANDPDYSPPRLPDTHYAVIDLDQWGLEAGDDIYFINDKLQIAGTTTYDEYFHAPFRWEAGQKIPLAVPPSVESPGEIYLQDMNNAGVVVGEHGGEALVWSQPAAQPSILPTALPPSSGGLTFSPEGDWPNHIYSINDSGQMVGMTSGHVTKSRLDEMGHSVTDSGYYQATTRWEGNSAQIIGPIKIWPPGDEPSRFGQPAGRVFSPQQINNAGWMLGGYADEALWDCDAHIAVRDGSTGAITVLVSPSSASFSVPYTMDAASPPHITGWSAKNEASSTKIGATLWEKNGSQGWAAKELLSGVFTQMNLRGEIRADIVSLNGSEPTRHSIMRNLKPVDLDMKVSPGWSNLSVQQINNQGVIVGTAYHIDPNIPNAPATNPHVQAAPVEILVPQIDAAGNPTDPQGTPSAKLVDGSNRLKIAQWENAYDGEGLNFPTVKDDFIKYDPDRFYIRIPNLGNSTTPMEVELSTLGRDGTEMDAPKKIVIVSYTDDPGFVKSEAHLLVSDDVDDQYFLKGAGTDESVLDRTHKIELGGKLKITVKVGNLRSDVLMTIPSKERIKIVKIKAIIVRNTAGGTAPVTIAQVRDDIARNVCQRFAQINVRAELDGDPIIMDPPADTNFTVGVNRENGDDLAIIDEAIAKGYSRSAIEKGLFYVSALLQQARDGSYIRAKYLGNALVQSDYTGINSKYANNSFIGYSEASALSEMGPLTAHELIHLLMNTHDHYDDNASHPHFISNIFRSGASMTEPSTIDAVARSKRIFNTQKQIIRRNIP